MVAFTYRNGGWTDDLFYFIDAPVLIVSVTGSATQAVVSDGLFVEMIVTGTGLGWTGTTPNAGTVTGLELRVDGVTRVTVADLSLPFADFTAGTYRAALAAASATHADLAGDLAADFMQGGAASDSFYSADGNDTLSGGGAEDNFFVTERDGALPTALDIRGGGAEDSLFIVQRAGVGNFFVNLATSSLSSIELMQVLGGASVVMDASQGAGLGVHMAAGASMTVLQDANVALNMNTLFPTLTRGGGTIWLWLEGTGVGDRQIGANGFNNILMGRVGDDTLSGGDLQDELDGDIGNDSLLGNGGSDMLKGGIGDDTLAGNAGFDQMIGGIGDDLYRIDADDTVYEVASEGTDWVQAAMSLILTDYAHVENARLQSGGAFGIDGSDGANELVGNSLANVLNGSGGRDTITGNDGNDQINGGLGADRLYGGKGSDRIDGGTESDVLNGDAGNDSIYGSAGEESVMGGDGDDLISGGADYDGAYGGAGNDAIYGGSGNDQLFGDDGNDVISGGSGNDTMDGGLGRDTFIFSTGSGRDAVFAMVSTGVLADRVDLRALTAVTSYADLVQNHLRQAGANVELRAGTDVLVLVGKTLAQLDAADFMI